MKYSKGKDRTRYRSKEQCVSGIDTAGSERERLDNVKLEANA